MEDTDLSFIENLLPWSEALPDICRKRNRNKSEYSITARKLEPDGDFFQDTDYLPFTDILDELK